MNLDTHVILLFAIAAVALVVWLIGLQFLISTARGTTPSSDMWDDDEELAAVRGSAEVDGRPAELAAKAAAHLAQTGMPALGTVTILEQTDQRVVFEAQAHLGGRFMRRGILDLQATGADRTRIDYTVTIPHRNGLLIAGWIVQLLGLVALIGGFLAMFLWVAPDPRPAVHWQSVQMIHVLHFLWPPFLLAGLYRRVRTHVRNTFDSLVRNLPYLKV